MGRRYTEEEERVIRKFIKDHETATNAELARMMKSYGLFLERSDKALELQIGKLRNPQKEDDSSEATEQLTIDDIPVTAIVESDYRKLSEKYESLMYALLGSAEPWSPHGVPIGIRFNLNKIKDWLYENEPRRVNALFEDMEER